MERKAPTTGAPCPQTQVLRLRVALVVPAEYGHAVGGGKHSGSGGGDQAVTDGFALSNFSAAEISESPFFFSAFLPVRQIFFALNPGAFALLGSFFCPAAVLLFCVGTNDWRRLMKKRFLRSDQRHLIRNNWIAGKPLSAGVLLENLAQLVNEATLCPERSVFVDLIKTMARNKFIAKTPERSSKASNSVFEVRGPANLDQAISPAGYVEEWHSDHLTSLHTEDIPGNVWAKVFATHHAFCCAFDLRTSFGRDRSFPPPPLLDGGGRNFKESSQSRLPTYGVASVLNGGIQSFHSRHGKATPYSCQKELPYLPTSGQH